MIKNSCHFHPTLDLSAPKAYNIVNVKTNFVLNVYAAPGACREAADFLSRPFASAGGGYSKRQIYLSFTIALPGIIPKAVTYYIKRIYPSSTQLYLTEQNVLNLCDDVAPTKEAVKI